MSLDAKSLFKLHYALHRANLQYVTLPNGTGLPIDTDAEGLRCVLVNNVPIKQYPRNAKPLPFEVLESDRVTIVMYLGQWGFIVENRIVKKNKFMKIKKPEDMECNEQVFEWEDEQQQHLDKGNTSCDNFPSDDHTPSSQQILSTLDALAIHGAIHDLENEPLHALVGENVFEIRMNAAGLRNCNISNGIDFIAQNLNSSMFAKGQDQFSKMARKGHCITWIRCHDRHDKWGLIVDNCIERSCHILREPQPLHHQLEEHLPEFAGNSNCATSSTVEHAISEDFLPTVEPHVIPPETMSVRTRCANRRRSDSAEQIQSSFEMQVRDHLPHRAIEESHTWSPPVDDDNNSSQMDVVEEMSPKMIKKKKGIRVEYLVDTAENPRIVLRVRKSLVRNLLGEEFVLHSSKRIEMPQMCSARLEEEEENEREEGSPNSSLMRVTNNKQAPNTTNEPIICSTKMVKRNKRVQKTNHYGNDFSEEKENVNINEPQYFEPTHQQPKQEQLPLNKQVDNRKEFFCYCLQPYTGKELMIACDNCQKWYFARCAGITIVAGMHFICPTCLFGKEEMLAVVRMIEKREDSNPFCKPETAPSYINKVKEPLDLRQLKQEIREGSVANAFHLMERLVLLFENHMYAFPAKVARHRTAKMYIGTVLESTIWRVFRGIHDNSSLQSSLTPSTPTPDQRLKLLDF